MSNYGNFNNVRPFFKISVGTNLLNFHPLLDDFYMKVDCIPSTFLLSKHSTKHICAAQQSHKNALNLTFSRDLFLEQEGEKEDRQESIKL